MTDTFVGAGNVKVIQDFWTGLRTVAISVEQAKSHFLQFGL